MCFYLQTILNHMEYVQTKLSKNKSDECKLVQDILSMRGQEEEEQKRICRELNPDMFVKYVGTCFMGTIVSLLKGWGQNRPVGAMCKILQKEDMIGWDEKGMWCIKCCGDVGLMHDPNDQVHVIFEWKDDRKSPSTETLLSYMGNTACELLVSGSPRIGKSLEVFWAAVQLWEKGNDVV